MTDNTLEAVFTDYKPLKKKLFKTGGVIFFQGETVKNIFSILDGQVKLERTTIEGRSVVMYTANTGDSFAEAALFSDTYHCNAIACKDSQVYFYPKQAVLDMLQTQPHKSIEFIRILASQVRSLRTKLEIRNILSARERILHYLYLMADPTSGEIFLKSSLKSVAEELGMAHETLYRELARFAKEGIILRTENKITLCSNN